MRGTREYIHKVLNETTAISRLVKRSLRNEEYEYGANVVQDTIKENTLWNFTVAMRTVIPHVISGTNVMEHVGAASTRLRFQLLERAGEVAAL